MINIERAERIRSRRRREKLLITSDGGIDFVDRFCKRMSRDAGRKYGALKGRPGEGIMTLPGTLAMLKRLRIGM